MIRKTGMHMESTSRQAQENVSENEARERQASISRERQENNKTSTRERIKRMRGQRETSEYLKRTT
eukprot:817280-Amorphochlora_amoeboformis.AAC.1